MLVYRFGIMISFEKESKHAYTLIAKRYQSVDDVEQHLHQQLLAYGFKTHDKALYTLDAPHHCITLSKTLIHPPLERARLRFSFDKKLK